MKKLLFTLTVTLQVVLCFGQAVRSVPTIDNMVTNVPPTILNGQPLLVLESNRGGLFKPIDVTTTNLGTIFPSTLDGTKVWQRIYEGDIMSTWFGVVASDESDDTSAIQAAINFADSNRGGTVILPLGTNRITQITIPKDVFIRGIVMGNETSDGTVLYATSSTTDAVLIQDRNAGISDMRIEGPGNSSGTSIGITLDDNTGTTPTISRNIFKNLIIQNFPGDGIVLVKPELSVIENVTSQNNGGRGLYIHDDGLVIGIDCLFQNFRANNNLGLYQVHIEDVQNMTFLNFQALAASVGNSTNNTLVYLQSGSDHHFINSDIEGPGSLSTGLLSTSSNLKIDNGFFSNMGIGASLQGNRNVLFSPRFTTTMVNSIVLTNGASLQLSMSRDNSTSGTAFNSVEPYIYIDDDSSGAIDITRNYVREINKFRQLADGDATPTVSQGNNFSTANSSPTSITTFDDPIDGQSIQLYITDANTTFINDFTTGKIRLAEGLDYNAQVNDSIGFIYRSGSWVETHRTIIGTNNWFRGKVSSYPGEWVAATGTPAAVYQGRHYGWSFDGTSSEQVAFWVNSPTFNNWANDQLGVVSRVWYFDNNSSAGGNIRLQLTQEGRNDGDLANSSGSSTSVTGSVPATQWEINYVDFAEITLTQSELHSWRLQRVGGDAADTHNTDVIIFAVEFFRQQ